MALLSGNHDAYANSRLYCIRHSDAHIMAQAVCELFPGAKLAIGPPIADGFYYDFDLPRSLTQDDLAAIEERMCAIIAENHPFVCTELSTEAARARYYDQPYKLELIDGLALGATDDNGAPINAPPVISTYRQGSFEDLCRGPHVARESELDPVAIKLLRVSSAYWRGDEHNPMLQRIYGTAFQTAEELERHLVLLEEAKSRHVHLRCAARGAGPDRPRRRAARGVGAGPGPARHRRQRPPRPALTALFPHSHHHQEHAAMSTDTAHPTPGIVIPGGRDLPPEIQALIARLSEPFPLTELRVRPGQVRRDGTAAQVLPYAEWWGSYQPRLDAVLGRANWRIRLIPWGTDSIIARMTVFGGLIERGSTGSSKDSFDGGQDAEAQAMKRVCARAVGLGLYLYALPEVWGRGERDGKRFFFADGEEERCLHELYRRAGLVAIPQPGHAVLQRRPRLRRLPGAGGAPA